MMKSIGFDKRTWMTGNGWYRRDQVRVFERRRLPSLNYLEYQFMIDDPKTSDQTMDVEQEAGRAK